MVVVVAEFFEGVIFGIAKPFGGGDGAYGEWKVASLKGARFQCFQREGGRDPHDDRLGFRFSSWIQLISVFALVLLHPSCRYLDITQLFLDT